MRLESKRRELAPARLALFALILATACSPDSEPGPSGPVVTTDDGVRVVQNSGPHWAEGEAWTLSPEPFLTLGVDVGDEHEMFTNADGLRLPDGRVVVFERGANELRWFDAEGGFLFARGRTGEGPGEFGAIGPGYLRPDGSILVHDFRNRRYTVYDADGEFLEQFTLEPHGMEYTPGNLHGLAGDGSLLARAAARPFPRIPEGEIAWRDFGLFRYSEEGAFLGHLADVPFAQSTARGTGLAFEARGLVAAASDGFHYTDGQSFEVETYDQEGRLVQRFRRPGEPISVTQEDRDAWVARSRENIEAFGGDPQGEAQLANTLFADTFPTWTNIMVDADDHVWLERSEGLGSSRPMIYPGAMEGFERDSSTWDVFTPDGVWLGALDLPAWRAPRQIGDDFVLMAGQGEGGVSRVWLHRLER